MVLLMSSGSSSQLITCGLPGQEMLCSKALIMRPEGSKIYFNAQRLAVEVISDVEQALAPAVLGNPPLLQGS